MERVLQLLVAGGDGAVLLEPVDGPLDPVALPVRRAVEAGAAPGLLRLAGDDRPDPPAAQVGADAAPGVALVAGHPRRAEPGAAAPRAAAPRALDGAPLRQRRR